jgi:hypothetical protein
MRHPCVAPLYFGIHEQPVDVNYEHRYFTFCRAYYQLKLLAIADHSKVNIFTYEFARKIFCEPL